ncbi:fumarylacetoacetate hydrolase family protein [Bacillus horti]|uniref:Fumarylacetoacetate (FAA) hydrolase n=1 Tax=Caldalkalibacillus horti TaxID=77523 RepID=A0ABT9VXA9_9BACI|nr:fumarylacetoacetate hydrolase family protein [Bacillus horti]MDQ0165452.1 fumarylacetoacetate (FAA) hydrolase [Bacillus horti]
MKWLTYRHPSTGEQRAGYLWQSYIIDFEKSLQFIVTLQKQRSEQKNIPFEQKLIEKSSTIQKFPITLLGYLEHQETYKPCLKALETEFMNWEEEEWKRQIEAESPWVIAFDAALLSAPLPRPPSFRDFYAFEAHVRNARKQRGLDMVQEWYHFPSFYFSNHQSILGPNEEVAFPSSSVKWDYELEVGIVIGKQGRNISREKAIEHVFGLTIVNDWSARDLQAEEVKIGLGPAKGKDFATTMGPFVSTVDEWQDRRQGEHVQLKMEAYVNGERTSTGDLNQLYFSIPELIARASQDCTLYPGDILGTGTVGTGSLLEQGKDWLKAGDQVTLKVERIGFLESRIKA